MISEQARVISDIRIIGAVNGGEVHPWLQKKRPELKTKVISISGDTANSEMQALQANSRIRCIEKPFRLKQLLFIVEGVFVKP